MQTKNNVWSWRDGSEIQSTAALPDPSLIRSNHMMAPNRLQLQFWPLCA